MSHVLKNHHARRGASLPDLTFGLGLPRGELAARGHVVREAQAQMNVADIKPGAPVTGKFLAAQVERRTAKNRNDYLWTLLRDKTGASVVALFFEAPQAVFESIKPGMTVEIRGEGDKYLNSTNVKIADISPAPEQWDAAELLPRSEKAEADMLAELGDYVARIGSPYVKGVVDRVLASPEVAEKLSRWPAAKSRHHAVIGGLLEHILEVLAIADAVANLYPKLRRDLLYAGCVLHDIGKVVELGIGADIDYTAAGIMVGHVVIGDQLVAKACAEAGCPPGLTLELRNMMLGHHGTLEWGSPVVPKTPEAVAVHHIDMLSSRVRQATEITERIAPRAPGDPVSQWDRAFGQNWFLGTANEESVSPD